MSAIRRVIETIKIDRLIVDAMRQPQTSYKQHKSCLFKKITDVTKYSTKMFRK